MPLTRIIDFAMLALSIGVVVYFLPGAVRGVQNYVGTGSRRQQDATGRLPDPDPEVLARMQALEAVGYRRLGETLTEIPGGAGPASILASADALSYVILVAGWSSTTGLSGFYSAWPDGTWLGTIHPRGTPLAFRSLRLRVETGSLDAAAAAHRAEAARLANDHGSPAAVHTMADMLALDADYRIRFGGRELRPLLARALVPLAIGLAMTILTLVIVARP